MIKVQGALPRNLVVAVSGGADSMAVLHFLSKNHNVSAVFCDHNTKDSRESYKIVRKFVTDNNITLLQTTINQFRAKKARESQEEYWRNYRYYVFRNHVAVWRPNEPIITAHHLNDCVETWIWSALHGNGKLIPYRNNSVIRPFRLNKKRDLEMWCHLNGIEYYKDESNDDTKYMRNYIRHELMPHALKVNPGLEKVIRKKIARSSLSEMSNEKY